MSNPEGTCIWYKTRVLLTKDFIYPHVINTVLLIIHAKCKKRQRHNY